MAKITQKMIVTHFIDTFLQDEVLTSSSFKQFGWQLKNLKKVVKTYIEDAGIETDKSVEQIIMECIDYCGMIGRKYKSIASLGYTDLPKSIAYWKKHEEVLKAKAEEEERKAKEAEEEAKLIELQNANNEQRANNRKLPKWMLEDDD